jgi:hypothetical protein
MLAYADRGGGFPAYSLGHDGVLAAKSLPR